MTELEQFEGGDAIAQWPWFHPDSEDTARRLVEAVDDARAHRVPEDGEVGPSVERFESRELWIRAARLAEDLGQAEPGPFPRAVEDALQQVEGVSDELALASRGDHGPAAL